ncbi:Sensor histidine kinase [hydrothermal vent metagenome]|uniref:histidine kinase n=1 Tax=hydrothermal vent metagenome TaxID=652676 RepID=A0A3B0RK22_9ZZZZ
MRRAFPQSLAGRLIFWLLASLLALQLGMMFLQEQKRKTAIQKIVVNSTYSQAMMVARVLDGADPEKWASTLEASSADDLALRVDTKRQYKMFIEMKGALEKYPVDQSTAETLETLKTKIKHIAITAVPEEEATKDQVSMKVSWFQPDTDSKNTFVFSPDTEFFEKFPKQNIASKTVPKGVSVQLTDGRWLNAAMRPMDTNNGWRNLLPLAISAGLLVLVVITVVHMETRSLKTLTEAADKLGRGEKLDPLPETGPRETRATLRAFNQMGGRIGRFVSDRTQMLAAMSHDLRTPLTSMRLRVEDIEDANLREKLIGSIEEMKQMAEASLAFAQADAVDEPGSEIDLTDLVQSVVLEFQEMDAPVFWQPDNAIPVFVRPLAIKRALRNLIENALRYGEVARLTVSRLDGKAILDIEDDGPGIAEADLQRVFEPFTRLESSRNRTTGGVGLGLAIARSIIHSHGAELTLHNLSAGGLRARILLQEIYK